MSEDVVSVPEVVHLSRVVGGSVLDRSGDRVGKVEDMIVRLGDEEYPPITGIVAAVAGRQVFVPADQIAAIEPGRVTLRAVKLDLQRFERRPQEVLLRKDVLDRQLINIDGARLVRANDLALAETEGQYRAVGVDVGLSGFLRRLLPRRLASRVGPGALLDWASVEPFTGHVPTVRLRVPHPKLARLHPAQLADLIEAASHREGAEIIDAAKSDAELEADVFEELDPQHQVEFVSERSDVEAAQLLARMEPDDAADLVNELAEERREPILELLPYPQRRRVRALLGYDPATAGGLMSPDFLCLPAHTTRTEALGRICRSKAPAELLAWIYVMNEQSRLRGALQLADLLRAEEGTLADLAPGGPISLRPDVELEEVARTMADYDLTAVPVVGEDEQMLGVVTVDDVLEVALPSGWRRQFGLLGRD